MSIIVVAIRILYNINGLGACEGSFSNPKVSCSTYTQERSDRECDSEMRDNDEEGSGSPSTVHDSGTKSRKSPSHSELELDVEELLCNLEAKYIDLADSYGNILHMTLTAVTYKVQVAAF